MANPQNHTIMKKFIIVLTALFTLAVSAHAMSYEQARQQALFLTDKMAYELNLTEQQYEAAYEVNLDYLLSINTRDDLYGNYWIQRNTDLSYILFDWQYRAFCEAAYFYRPLYWDAGFWHFAIYARYPHRSYFYYGRPHFWHVYHGGHSWRHNGGRSWYRGRDFGHHRPQNNHFGMRDGFKRGDYRNGFDGNRGNTNRTFGGLQSGNRNGSDRGNSSRFGNGGNDRGNSNRFGNGGNNIERGSRIGQGIDRDSRESSTRQTVTFGNRPSSNIGISRGTTSTSRFNSTPSSSPNRSFTPAPRSSSSSSTMKTPSSSSSSSFGGSRGSFSRSSGSSFGGSRSSGSSFGGSRSSGSFSGGSHSGGSRGGGFGRGR